MAIVVMDERRAALLALVEMMGEITCPARTGRSSRLLADDHPVMLALSSELLHTVLPRLDAYEPPVILAVYDTVAHRVELAELHPAERGDDTVPVDLETTVGMLLSAGKTVALPNSWVTIGLKQLVPS